MRTRILIYLTIIPHVSLTIFMLITCFMHIHCPRGYVGFVLLGAYVLPILHAILATNNFMFNGRLRRHVFYYGLGIISMLLFCFAYYGLFTNRKEKKSCISKWIYIGDIFGLIFGVILCCFLVINLVFCLRGNDFIGWYKNWVSQSSIRSNILKLYNLRNAEEFRKALERDYETRECMESYTIFEEELPLVLNLMKKNFSRKSILPAYCSICSIELHELEEYYGVPFCLHRSHLKCIEEHMKNSPSAIKCVVCDNNIRTAVLKCKYGIRDDIMG